jgi:hypothetical protein
MELEPILLRSQKKLKGKVTSRTKTVQETLDTILPVSSSIGVTRLADITDMDILRIPNFSAVLPGTGITFGSIVEKDLQNWMQRQVL